MAQPVIDRLAIQDVMTRYAIGVDTRDLDLFRGCFVRDVIVTGFPGNELIRGREKWVAYVRKLLDRFGPTQHLITNYLVEQRGDEANMTSSVQATHVLASDPRATFTLWATYHDLLVRQDGKWRIKQHRLEPISTQTRRSD